VLIVECGIRFLGCLFCITFERVERDMAAWWLGLPPSRRKMLLLRVLEAWHGIENLPVHVSVCFSDDLSLDIPNRCYIWYSNELNFEHTFCRTTVWGCIQKLPDWGDNEINNNNKHSLRSNTKCYGGKTQYTDSQNSNTTAPGGRELHHMQFSLQAASPETFGYTLLYYRISSPLFRSKHLIANFVFVR
jgi:hypothetical protein